MSVTFGFYNSLNGDRKYNAVQMGALFDGLINDGIYMSIGNQFMVKATEGLTLSVGEGRAWFNHTWTLNDAQLLIDIEAPDLLLPRIDAVVIEVNSTDGVRANSIKIVKGTPATEPVRPTLTNNDLVHQYPLAYVDVAKDAQEITQANITNTVGTSSTPYVTGVLQKMDITNLVAQWQQQWTEWKTEKEQDSTDWTDAQRAAWEEWVGAQEQAMGDWMDEYKNELTAFKNVEFADFNAFQANAETAFDLWFDNLKVQLSEDVAGNLQVQIEANAEKEFNRYYGLVVKSTTINKNTDGSLMNIVETSDEAVCTTTVVSTEIGKVITTEVVPEIGGFKYVKVTSIIETEQGTTIAETFSRENKEV